MDSDEAYRTMMIAFKSGDHETAREIAVQLRAWIDRGGFYPAVHTETTIDHSIRHVMDRTLHLEYA